VHIMYCHNPTPNPTYPKSRILKEVHYYISNEKKHDTLYVQHAFKLNWEFLREKECFLEWHVVWFDGCNGQFKSVRCWFFCHDIITWLCVKSYLLVVKWFGTIFLLVMGRGKWMGLVHCWKGRFEKNWLSLMQSDSNLHLMLLIF
jgi:hypothetical protein